VLPVFAQGARANEAHFPCSVLHDFPLHVPHAAFAACARSSDDVPVNHIVSAKTLQISRVFSCISNAGWTSSTEGGFVFNMQLGTFLWKAGKCVAAMGRTKSSSSIPGG